MNEKLDIALKYHQEGQLDKSEEIYLETILEEPENAEALKLLGVLSCQKGKFDDGINYLEAAIEIDDQNAEYHLVLGNALLHKGDVEDGIVSLVKAGELDPGNAEVFATLGDTYQKITKFHEALTAYQRATVIEPDNIKHTICAGLCSIFTGQHETASEYLEQALEKDQSIPQIHYGLGVIQAESDNKEEAVKFMNRALELDPENPEYKRLIEDYST